MRRVFPLAALVGILTSAGVFGPQPAAAQTGSRARRAAPAPADAASVESIVAAYYGAVSHAAGAAPDFERLRGIFLYVGMIVPPKPAGESFSVRDVDALEEWYRKQPAAGREKGLLEREIARRTDCFGNVCHVLSTYEARWTESDARPFERGVRSIQLLRDGSRWWIASVTWDIERPDNPIPQRYLQAGSPGSASFATPQPEAGSQGAAR